jgi:hypothetical protein
MTLIDPSQTTGDELDGLLRAYFQRQMPQPWPAAPVPQEESLIYHRPQASGRALARSRWALAASIGLLVVGSLVLPARFTRDTRPNIDVGATPGSAQRYAPWREQTPRNQTGPAKNGPHFGVEEEDHEDSPEMRDLPGQG